MNYFTIELLGSQIAYADTMELKPCILFIHGNSLSSAVFIKQFEDSKLSNQFRLIALDMLGYGDSDRSKQPDKGYLFPTQVNLVVAFMKALKLSNVILAGHSFGGNVAIECAKKSDKILGLALLGSPIAEKPMSPEMFLPCPAIPLFFKSDMSDEERNFLSASLFRTDAPTLGNVIEILKKSDPFTRAFVMSVIMSGDYEDQLVSLKELNIPVASFHGGEEQLVNLAYLQKTMVPTQWENKVHVIAKGGHMFFYENPTDFNGLLARFAKDTLNGR